MRTRIGSIKETGEELSQAEWERFDAAVAAVRTERGAHVRRVVGPMRLDLVLDLRCDVEESAPARP